jgi:hypothetical protein
MFDPHILSLFIYSKMKQPIRWHAARIRQMRHTAKQLNRLAARGRFSETLQKKLERQWNYLSNRFSTRSLAKLMSGAALMLVMGTAQGQTTFNAPVTNPAGYTPRASQNYQFVSSADLDGDGDNDVIMGDPYNGLLYYENTGTATSPTFAAPVISPFGLPGLGSFNAQFADMDNDGDLDVFVATANFVTYNITYNYHENTGTPTAPAFGAAVTSPFGLNTGSYDVLMTIGDIDNDGDLDLFIGQVYYNNIVYYQNTGTATAPAFGAGQTNPFGLSGGYYQSAPQLVDLDGDGDLDMLVAEYYGNFQYHENTGTAMTPAFALAQFNPFGLQAPTTQEYYVGIALADMDGDGDQDILMSGYDGALYYYEQTSAIIGDPVLLFAGGGLTVTESTAGNVTVDVTILNPNANPTTADVRVGMASTASAGSDYTFTNPTQVVFAPGNNTPISITIPIIDDNLVEPDETIILELSNPGNNATFGIDSVYTITIQSEDVPPPPEVNFAVAGATVFENSVSYDILATLSAAQPMQVQVGVVSGAMSTASFGQDYTISASSFTFPANSTAQQAITVTLLNDSLVEGNELLSLGMVNPTMGVNIGNIGTFNLEILDNDFAVGTDALKAALGLSISPNPAREFVDIRMTQPEPLSCKLMDMQGKTLKYMALSGYSHRLEVGDLPPGLYVLQFEGEQGRGSMKMVVR